MPRGPVVHPPMSPDLFNHQASRSPEAWQMPQPPRDSLIDRTYSGPRAYPYPDRRNLSHGDDAEVRTLIDGNDYIFEFKVNRLVQAEDSSGQSVPSYELSLRIPEEEKVNKQSRPPIITIPQSVFSTVRPYDKVNVDEQGRQVGKSRGVGNEVDLDLNKAIAESSEENQFLLRALALRARLLGSIQEHVRNGNDVASYPQADLDAFKQSAEYLSNEVYAYKPDTVYGNNKIRALALRGLKYKVARAEEGQAINTRETIQLNINRLICPEEIKNWADSLQ